MAECHLQYDATGNFDNYSLFNAIPETNARLSDEKVPDIPLTALLMREQTSKEKVRSSTDEVSKGVMSCGIACNPETKSWQRSYLEKYPDLDVPPTAISVSGFMDYSAKPIQIHEPFLTRKQLEHEIAKHKLIQLFRGRFDFETLREQFCSGRGSKEEVTFEEEPKPKEEVTPRRKSSVKPKPSRSNSLEPEHSILKNPLPPPDVPRTPKPYKDPAATNTGGGVDFFPGKPRLAQRYKADDINQARKRKPIVEEADARFAMKSGTQTLT